MRFTDYRSPLVYIGRDMWDEPEEDQDAGEDPNIDDYIDDLFWDCRAGESEDDE